MNNEKLIEQYKMELTFLVRSYVPGDWIAFVIPWITIVYLCITALIVHGELVFVIVGTVTFFACSYTEARLVFKKPTTRKKAYRAYIAMMALIFLHKGEFTDERSLPNLTTVSGKLLYKEFITIYPEYQSKKLERLTKIDF